MARHEDLDHRASLPPHHAIDGSGTTDATAVRCVRSLDSKKPQSMVLMNFGSMARTSPPQLRRATGDTIAPDDGGIRGVHELRERKIIDLPHAVCSVRALSIPVPRARASLFSLPQFALSSFFSPPYCECVAGEQGPASLGLVRRSGRGPAAPVQAPPPRQEQQSEFRFSPLMVKQVQVQSLQSVSLFDLGFFQSSFSILGDASLLFPPPQISIGEPP
ncbi:hypothetical protein HU200_040620 [Digitaria exilis]|uniref:Uncharacterized protein n=1 Tax=Digitaria exilis TaxID=1010633 RepID=A0A835B9F4_9POAL|nr:hypothetical protein HU200_040620 [Digitaria exilis]